MFQDSRPVIYAQDPALLSLGGVSISFLTFGQIAHSYFHFKGQLGM